MEKFTIFDFQKSKLKPMTNVKSMFNMKQTQYSQLISCGGIGCVYKIMINNNIFCIKLQQLKMLSDDFVNMYRKQRINDILKNYISGIFEIGKITINGENFKYIIMEYVQGTSLVDTHLTNYQVCLLFIFLLDFMTIVHSNNLSYSDIKPDNIIMSSNGFKIIDVDTFTYLLSQNSITNTITPLYDVTDTTTFSSHQLSQIYTCIFTCLSLMNMYPTCDTKTNKSIYLYGNALFEIANNFGIYRSQDLEQKFDEVYTYIINITHNILYTLLSMMYLNILLIPKYTVAYYNVNFWKSKFYTYLQYIPNTYEIGNQICSKSASKQKIQLIRSNHPDRWTNETNPDYELSRIPCFINYDLFTTTYLQQYIKMYKQIYNRYKSQSTYRELYKKYIEYDIYSFLRQDPRATVGTPFYKRI